MKEVKKKIAIFVLLLCLPITNLFTSLFNEEYIRADNFNGEYILPNHIPKDKYKLLDKVYVIV